MVFESSTKQIYPECVLCRFERQGFCTELQPYATAKKCIYAFEKKKKKTAKKNVSSTFEIIEMLWPFIDYPKVNQQEEKQPNRWIHR